jgi:hypothetical protein
MDFCRIADRLYDALPVRPLRDWLIRGHVEKCPRCQARLLSRDEAKSLLVGPDEIGPADPLWSRIAAVAACPAALNGRVPARAGLIWRWAAAATLAVVLAVAGFWLLREVERPGLEMAAAAADGRFEIAYLKVGGAPAQAFVYQPQGTDTVFVWASRNP